MWQGDMSEQRLVHPVFRCLVTHRARSLLKIDIGASSNQNAFSFHTLSSCLLPSMTMTFDLNAIKSNIIPNKAEKYAYGTAGFRTK